LLPGSTLEHDHGDLCQIRLKEKLTPRNRQGPSCVFQIESAGICSTKTMKTRIVRILGTLVLLGLTFSFCTTAIAGPPPGELLREAYISLEKADHDYKGNRKAAMEQIEKAAKLVGVNVRGEGRGHEKQGVSDEQLRAAQSLLRDARGGLSGNPVKHVNKALEHLSTALKIK
jgi:hypothetical protein